MGLRLQVMLLALAASGSLAACASSPIRGDRGPAAIPASRKCEALMAGLARNELERLLPIASTAVFPRVGRSNVRVMERQVKTVRAFNESLPNRLSFEVGGRERFIHPADIRNIGDTVVDSAGEKWRVAMARGRVIELENGGTVVRTQKYADESENLLELKVEITGLKGEKSISQVKIPNFEDPGSRATMENWVLDFLGSLPRKHVEEFRDFSVSPGAFRMDFRVRGLFEHRGERVTIFMASTEDPATLQETAWHEYGHYLATKVYGTADTDMSREYAFAVREDGTSVSKYGDTSLAEDYAEAVRMYFVTDAGRLDPKVRDRLRNRFELLDRVMNARAESIEGFMADFYGAKRSRNRKIFIVAATGGVVSFYVLKD